MKYAHMAAFLLVIVGALNWLAVGAVGKDISMFLGGMDSMLARGVYVLVGLAGIYLVATHKKDCKWCMGHMDTPSSAVH